MQLTESIQGVGNIYLCEIMKEEKQLEREKERKEGRDGSKGQLRKQKRWKRSLEDIKEDRERVRMEEARKKRIEEGDGKGKRKQGKECICQIIAKQHCTVNLI